LSGLRQLAAVLQTSPESDALLILGQLLDSLPIGFHVNGCTEAFNIEYANDVWERWLEPSRLPVVGKGLAEVFPAAAQTGIVGAMREVCRTGESQHLKNFEFRGLGIVRRGKSSKSSRWDWEIYPLRGPTGGVAHLLNVVMEVTEPTPRKGRPSPAERQAVNRKREQASGVLRIFGFAPGPEDREPVAALSEREQRVADHIALGLTNAGVAGILGLSRTTIATHVAHILFKLGFHSRAQVAAWVAYYRLHPETWPVPRQESLSEAFPTTRL